MSSLYKQSVVNAVSTYAGFALGALNTLVLYVHVLEVTTYGLLSWVLAAATLMMPWMTMGVPNTLLKFFPAIDDDREKAKFLGWMLWWPLVIVIPMGILVAMWGDVAAEHWVQSPDKVAPYLMHFWAIGALMAYFEVFYSLAKARLRSVFGNVLKEVSHRLLTTVVLLMMYVGWISSDQLFFALVLIYLVRTLAMAMYSVAIVRPVLAWGIPSFFRDYLSYGLFVVLGTAVALVILEIDKVMIHQFLPLSEVAYYTVAVFMATMVSVPARATHQIALPLSAQWIASGQWEVLKSRYLESAIQLSWTSGWVLLVLWSTAPDLFSLLPDGYQSALWVLLLIGISKWMEASMGINNALLLNAPKYKWVLYTGVVMAICTIGFNLWLIPQFGIIGAAWASLAAMLLYQCAKVWAVYSWIKVHPWQPKMALILVWGALSWWVTDQLFSLINLPVLAQMAATALTVSVLYLWGIYRLGMIEYRSIWPKN